MRKSEKFILKSGQDKIILAKGFNIKQLEQTWDVFIFCNITGFSSYYSLFLKLK